MSFHDDSSDRRRRKPPSGSGPDEPASPRPRRRNADSEVGDALRSAYDRVVDEDIPPEMLDLLGKLG